ncbi:MAG: GNAT superfamily N-acetyltransferase [Crocinitomicaceae bacterium]|jgi:GNAT superfamily N-acetyltransferase
MRHVSCQTLHSFQYFRSMSIRIVSSSDVHFTAVEQELLFDIMRHAYATTEIEIWGENYVRISKEEFVKLIEGGGVLVAYYNDEIAGCVNTFTRSDASAGFGLLATHRDFTKRGIGSALVRETEDRAKKSGATCMDIEILRPRDTEVPGKVVLQKWYEMMGYEYVYSEDFAIRIPIKAKRLLVPSNFDCYRKVL